MQARLIIVHVFTIGKIHQQRPLILIITVILHLLMLFFLHVGFVLPSVDPLDPFELICSLSPLLGEPLLEGILLFLLVQSFHGLAESLGGILVELLLASLFLLFANKVLLLFY